ncbi:RING finger protein 215 [Acipenser ruthenus]|uniref:RING finger protein 215 n=1 Tax=Acipenser ruthenus TaxID=7906 RepID=A0A444V7D9_ACIRT|nr:RING finger protein 215 [Acipenser ruthenus]
MVVDEGQEQDSPVKREAAEPWIGLVPVEVEQAEAQRGSQETFAAAVVSKVVDEGQEQDSPVKREAAEPWIGLVPVEVEQAEAQRGSQETFAAAVVSKMKRALVLGASALLILALNQNTIREMDLSQVLSKPVVVIQTSENVTKLIGALLRGLRATAKITYKSILQDNLGATLTLWSSCGRSRSGLYGEWQGVICTGETNSQVQKYLQQLWNTILLVALILCTGVVVQARWQYRHYQSNEDMELHPKHDIVKHLAALKTRQYHPLGAQEQGGETENCAVCLEQFHKKQAITPQTAEFSSNQAANEVGIKQLISPAVSLRASLGPAPASEGFCVRRDPLLSLGF